MKEAAAISFGPTCHKLHFKGLPGERPPPASENSPQHGSMPLTPEQAQHAASARRTRPRHEAARGAKSGAGIGGAVAKLRLHGPPPALGTATTGMPGIATPHRPMQAQVPWRKLSAGPLPTDFRVDHGITTSCLRRERKPRRCRAVPTSVTSSKCKVGEESQMGATQVPSVTGAPHGQDAPTRTSPLRTAQVCPSSHAQTMPPSKEAAPRRPPEGVAHPQRAPRSLTRTPTSATAWRHPQQTDGARVRRRRRERSRCLQRGQKPRNRHGRGQGASSAGMARSHTRCLEGCILHGRWDHSGRRDVKHLFLFFPAPPFLPWPKSEAD